VSLPRAPSVTSLNAGRRDDQRWSLTNIRRIQNPPLQCTHTRARTHTHTHTHTYNAHLPACFRFVTHYTSIHSELMRGLNVPSRTTVPLYADRLRPSHAMCLSMYPFLFFYPTVRQLVAKSSIWARSVVVVCCVY
jgi:hypothetical protein